MKKALFFITAIFVSSLFISCGFQKSSDKNPIIVGFSYSGRTSEPYKSNRESIRTVFLNNPKYKYFEMNAGCDFREQVSGIYQLIHRKPNFIIIDPVNEHGLGNVIENCNLANCRVILCGGSVTLEPGKESMIAYELRPDFYKEAVAAVECLEIYEKGKLNVNMVVLNDYSDSTSARERNRALGEGVERNKGWRIISKRETGGDYLLAKNLMEEIYEVHNGIDAIFVESTNDYQAVIDVLFKHGKMPGEDIFVFAFEDSEDARKMLLSGLLNFSVIKPQDTGNTIEGIVQKIKKGRSYDKYNLTECNVLYSNKTVEDAALSKKKRNLTNLFD
ncbi:MAG: substrate-binding domain-containing protein [Treponema sp.]|nr:substrate-binding domain-containing protein [Candidatus Treponema equi]